ncbi:MAG: hypothetical protein IJ920_06515 [Paludibacteraceae bacterium]|nr:hypothetical protein [Paludibacteraceae bacterium]
MRRHILFILLLLDAVFPYAAVPIVPPKLSESTGIAPAFFGPNALPVPDMLDGRTQPALRMELATDGFFGYEKDKTADLYARVNIPLWTDRVNLSVWMPIMEWYSMTLERQRTCRLQDKEPIQGHEAGDVYVSTDIQLLKARKYTPDIAFRAALKTASGGSFDKARYFDSPGYWFDVAVGKSMYIGKGVSAMDNENTFLELRLAGSLGFLCWQTDNGRQNDALMYGLQLFAKAKYVSLRATWGGYMGWEKSGDCPMSIKAQVNGHIKGFEPFVAYQYGIKDYPFHQLRIGLAYNLDILKYKKSKVGDK